MKPIIKFNQREIDTLQKAADILFCYTDILDTIATETHTEEATKLERVRAYTTRSALLEIIESNK